MGDNRCRNGLVRADVLEPAVWQKITNLLRNPVLLRQELRRRSEEDSPTRQVAAEELELTRKRRKEIPQDQDRLVEGYGKGLVPDDLMKVRMDTLRQEEAELEARVGELEGRLSRLELTDEQEASALRFAERVIKGLDNLTFSERQELLHLFVEDITYKSGEAVVRSIIPMHNAEDKLLLCTNVRGGRVGKTIWGGDGASTCFPNHPWCTIHSTL